MAMREETDKTTDPAPGFSALGLDPRVVAGLAALGYEEPTPVQKEAIPPLLAGRDVLGACDERSRGPSPCLDPGVWW